MSAAVFEIALRLRLRSVALAGFGLFAMILMVGALFPAVGDSFGELDVPEGVSNLLGGADYGTLVGWLNAEIASILAPLVIGAVAITGAAAGTAGEEEEGVLAVVLAHPVRRYRLVLAKACAVGVGVLGIALANFVGLIAGVAVAGGGIGIADLAAQSLHLALFGLAVGAVALALGAGSGQKAVAIGGAAAFAVFAFLINGFAPLVGAIEWMKYLSVFYYYAGNEPLANGVDLGNLAVLAGVTLAFVGIAVRGMRRRDLRG